MKIAVCAILKDEDAYLEEWLKHYIKLGVKDFILYDNESKYPVKSLIDSFSFKEQIKVFITRIEGKYKQLECYADACKRNADYDWIGFFDLDEYVELGEGTTLEKFLEQQPDWASGVGLYWRFYFSSPYFKTKQPLGSYTQYRKNGHIKSFVRPNRVKTWRDPHRPYVSGPIVDELGRHLNAPVMDAKEHTSNTIWIKHIWTRSLEEWTLKMERGRADCPGTRTIEDFYAYNKLDT